jgi:Putative auto-transporter adhesin, head GIN domain
MRCASLTLAAAALVAALLATGCGPSRGDTTHTLSLRGGEHVLEKLDTSVRDGTLILDPQDGGLNDDHEVEATITVPHLRAVEADGAGSIRLLNLDSEALELRNTGATDFTASGWVDRLSAIVEGAGELDLGNLKARDATVRIEGVGDAEVTVWGELHAVVTGVGDIEYRGNPTLRSDDEGIGEVRRAG